MNRIKKSYLSIIQIIRRLSPKNGNEKESYNVNKDYDSEAKIVPKKSESILNNRVGQEESKREFGSAGNKRISYKFMVLKALRSLKNRESRLVFLDYASLWIGIAQVVALFWCLFEFAKGQSLWAVIR